MQCGMTKYRKGPQRTTKEHYTGPQRTGNREKTAGCCVAQKLEFQTTAVSEKLLKIPSAALHTLLVFFAINLSLCCASIVSATKNQCSYTDVMPVMLFYCE